MDKKNIGFLRGKNVSQISFLSFSLGAAEVTLFRNKRFALNEMFQQNALKFAIFYVYENKCSFSFRATLYFYLMNALVYVDID